jgi:hypothetical protein
VAELDTIVAGKTWGFIAGAVGLQSLTFFWLFVYHYFNKSL